NPDESIELNGNTGAFIQYTYARIQSLLEKLEQVNNDEKIEIQADEKEIIKLLNEFPIIVQESGRNYSPATIANYIYELVKNFNSFYQSNNVMKEKNTALKNARILISKNTGEVIKTAMQLLGIQVPERM